MANTLPNIELKTGEWIDLYDQSGIAKGKNVTLNNVGNSDIYYAISPTQLSVDSKSYEVLKPRDISAPAISGLWAFSPTDDGAVNVKELVGEAVKLELPVNSTAFGELSVAENEPLFQVTAQYGILDDILTTALGGTTTTEDSKFVASTGTGANNVAAIISSREAQYRAGQGLLTRFTALFTQGVPNSSQQAGFITSESSFCFGFNGDSFGIVYSKDGQLENQELTITTGASGNENASVTVDGVLHSIPITSGTPTNNAFEIATFLDANEPRYNFSSVGAVVYALALLPDFGAGAFSFSSATAVGSWVQIQNGTIPTEAWIPKASWNVNPDISIDPTLGNVYQIQIQYLGFGGIRFFVEDPDTAVFTLVHVIRYANTSTIPIVSNPIFRVGWACRNSGNTSDIKVQGASAAAFVEGIIRSDSRPKSKCTTRGSVGNNRVNMLSFRNRLTFNDTANRAEIIPLLTSMISDANRTTFFEIIESPIYSSSPDFERFASNSLMELSTSDVEVVGGNIVACFTTSNKRETGGNLEDLLGFILPNVTYAITAENAGANDVDVALTWREDL